MFLVLFTLGLLILMWPLVKAILALLYMAMTIPILFAYHVFKTNPRTINKKGV